MTIKAKRRPKAIRITWFDPFDGSFCAGMTMYYTRRRSANSHFSRQAMAMKPLAKQWTGPRTPRLKVERIWQ